MNYDDIVLRCYRELNRSKTLPMLEVARNYSYLFMKHLRRKNVRRDIITNITKMLKRAYDRRFNQLS